MNGRSAGASTGVAAVGTLAARLAATALAVLTGIIVARMLGPAGKGAYSGVQVLLAVPVAAVGGAGAAITYAMAKERASIRDLFPTLSFVFCIATLATWIGSVVYGMARGWNDETIAFAAVVPPSIVLAWQMPYYIGAGRIHRLNAQTVGLAAGTLVAVFVATKLLHAGIAGTLAVWVGCTWVAAAVVVADMLRCGGRIHRTRFRERLRTFTRIGGQSGLNSLLGTVNYRVDSFVLIGLLGLTSYGIYSIAVSVGETLFMLSRSFTTAVSREIGASHTQRSAEVTARMIRISAWCVAAGAAVSFFIAPPLIDALYGTRFSAAAAPLRALLPGIVVFSSAGTFATFFTLQLGRPGIVSAINIVMIGVQAAACFIFVPRFGLVGAATASSVTYFLGAIVNTICFCRLTQLPAADVWVLRGADLARAREIADELLGHAHMRVRRPSGRETIVIDGKAARSPNLIRMRSRMAGARTVVVAPGALDASDGRELEPIRRCYTILESARLEGVRRIQLPPADENAANAAVAEGCRALTTLYAEKYALQITTTAS